MPIVAAVAALATPTEAASLGVCGALILAAANRRLTITMLRQAIEGCLRTTGMLMVIMMAAYFLNFILSAIGLTAMLREFIDGTSRLEGCLMVVVTNNDFLDDNPLGKGFGAYQALMGRIIDEVRDRSLVNPMSSLIRLAQDGAVE